MGGIDIAATHPHTDLRRLARQTADWLASEGKLAADVVVLVPFAQLMPLARQAWVVEVGRSQNCLLPRFVSTQQWACDMQALYPQVGSAFGWSPHTAIAHARARRMLIQTGLDKALGGRATASLIEVLLSASQALVVRAQAMCPNERENWLQQMRQQRVWGFDVPGFDADSVERTHLDAIEPALLRIALEWVGTSQFDTDVLWDPAVREVTPALVVWQGFQVEGLAQSLARHWGDDALVLPWPAAQDGALVHHQTMSIGERRFQRHAPEDEQQEAQWATACVLRHLQQGHHRIGVVALDRALVRRMHALLRARDVAVQDTTGWKLSTTHAATQLVAWLDAVRYQATTHEVLDAVAMACAQVVDGQGVFDSGVLRELEQLLTQTRHFQWPQPSFFEQGPQDPVSAAALAGSRIEGWRSALQKPRSLGQWLFDVRLVCAQMGLLEQFEQDAAGQAMLLTLHLNDPQAFALLHTDLASERLDLAGFSAWVRAALEAEGFIPDHPQQGDGPLVSLIPLSQVLGQPWDALVIPGCDEKHLPWCPADTSPWTRGQRAKLGLPTDPARSEVQFAAWQQAMAVARLDVLSRAQDAGEQMSPSPLLRWTLHSLHEIKQTWPAEQQSPMQVQQVTVLPQTEPAPSWTDGQLGDAALLQRLSPSAYEDLRRCPYRFHARRLLGLTQEEELSEEADKRDWGNWVHRVLHRFHTDRQNQPANSATLADQLDAAADVVQAQMRLDGASFVPFRAAWPGLRDAYAQWLTKYEAAGGEFVQGEVDGRAKLPEVGMQLVGRLDRLDRSPDGGHVILDYKTEADSKTRQRVSDPLEDTQLAFYALLMEPSLSGESGFDSLEAAYLNLGESGQTQRGQRELPSITLHSLADLQASARALRQGIASDVSRLRSGHALKPLGDGPVCEHCEVRGLCRRDFWRGHESA